MAVMILGAVGVAGLPSLICASPLGDALLARAVGESGWQLRAGRVHVGWMTPLELDEVRALGPSGATDVAIDRVRTELRLVDLLRSPGDWGTVTVGQVEAEGVVIDGQSSIETDIQRLIDAPGSSDRGAFALRLTSGNLVVSEKNSGAAWRLELAETRIKSRPQSDDRSLRVETVGRLTTPSGHVGELAGQGEVDLSADAPRWLASLQLSNMPLEVLELARLRFRDSHAVLPQRVRGAVDGAVSLESRGPGRMDCRLRSVVLQSVEVRDRRLGAAPWQVAQASLDGSLVVTREGLRGAPLAGRCDFGRFELDGLIQPERWRSDMAGKLGVLAGRADVQCDLARLAAAAPGLVPLRPDVRLESGGVRIQLERDGQPASAMAVRLESDLIRARDGRAAIVLEPAQMEVVLRPAGRLLTADRLELHSVFANATARGDLQQGQLAFDINLGRLATMLNRFVEFRTSELAGVASGKVKWAASGDGGWQLDGDATAAQLAIGLPGGRALREPSLELSMSATGRWDGQALAELTRAELRLRNAHQRWTVESTRPVSRPSPNTPLPIRMQGDGRLASLAGLLEPWLPTGYGAREGSYHIQLGGIASAEAGRVEQFQLTLDEPVLLIHGRPVAQDSVKANFEGDLAFPHGDHEFRKLDVVATAATLAAEGALTRDGHGDLEMAFRADLRRLSGAAGWGPGGSKGDGATTVGRAATTGIPTWWLQGELEGRARLRRFDSQFLVSLDGDLRDLAVLQPPPTASGSEFVGPVAPEVANRPPRLVWHEPTSRVRGQLAIDSEGGFEIAEPVRLETAWLDTSLEGAGRWADGVQLDVRGPARLDSAKIARRIEPLIGQSIRLQGSITTPVRLRLTPSAPIGEALDLTAGIGWDRGSIAGVTLGPAAIPVRLTDATLTFERARVPMKEGHLNLAGTVHYRPGPMWIEVPRGVFAEDVPLDEEMARTWLKYIAPLAANATAASGTFGVEFSDRAVIVVDEPERSRLAGRLRIGDARLGPGPLARDLVGLVDTVRAAGGRQVETRGDVQWLQLPPQEVEFRLEDGAVSHSRLFAEAGKVEILTSGRVALDGRLDLQAQIPVRKEWVGDDPVLASLVGQTLTLPIDGTLSAPSLDARGVRRAIADLLPQAASRAVTNVVQEQLERGLDKLLGR